MGQSLSVKYTALTSREGEGVPAKAASGELGSGACSTQYASNHSRTIAYLPAHQNADAIFYE